MISKEEVKHIAKLARLDLTDTEIIKMQKELSAILDYFNLLKEIDDKQPSFLKGGQLISFKNTTRKDIGRPGTEETISKLFNAAPQKEKGYIKVKTIF